LEQSGLTYNAACHYIQTIVGREQGKLTSTQYQLHSEKLGWRPKWKSCTGVSIADWLQYTLNNTELVEGSRRAGGPDENLIVITWATEYGEGDGQYCVSNEIPTGEFYLADPTLTVKNGRIQLSCYSHVKIRPEPPWS